MNDSMLNSIVTVATAIVGVAILAVIVSRNSNTSGVIGAAGNAFSNALGVAVSPVTGGSSFSGLGGMNFGTNYGLGSGWGY
jgi:hypothetical protein